MENEGQKTMVRIEPRPLSHLDYGSQYELSQIAHFHQA